MRSGPVCDGLEPARKNTPDSVAPVTSVTSADSRRFSIRNSDIAPQLSARVRNSSRVTCPKSSLRQVKMGDCHPHCPLPEQLVDGEEGDGAEIELPDRALDRLAV